jgi:hypothetical protein
MLELTANYNRDTDPALNPGPDASRGEVNRAREGRLLDRSVHATATRDGEPVARYYVDRIDRYHPGGGPWYALHRDALATDDDLRRVPYLMIAGRGPIEALVEADRGFLGWHEDVRDALAACRAHAEGL